MRCLVQIPYLRGLRLLTLLSAVQVWVLLVVSCDSPSSAHKVVGSPVRGLVATLEDEVSELPGGRIRWSTYWKLCWERYQGAKAYELQSLTSEGISPKLHRQSDRCFRIEAAAGENEKSQGFVNRELLLALQSGQLAYRVRAILDKNHVSEWSPSISVGKFTKP